MRVPKDCACQKIKRLMKDGIKRMVNKLEQDPLSAIPEYLTGTKRSKPKTA